MNDALQDFLDERAVIAVGLRYSRALDGRDWDEFLRCFTADARYGRAGHTVSGHTAIVTQAQKFLRRLDATQHVATNFEVRLDGDRARMRSYYIGTHMRRCEEKEEHFVLAGVYEDQMVRTSDGWRIEVRELVPQWTSGDPALLGPTIARRFGGDPGQQ
jgi:3-phenylpropionate/cinnamic acid dioxygenase small subunit